MGAYLSQPRTDKISSDEFNELLAVGASSMQGWRNSQEDAHNAILNFDENTAFFAVYDGHGGAEVATYCADKLPTFFKELQTYKSGQLEEALKECFLGFDKTLLQPTVVEILKLLAGEKNFVEADDSDAVADDEDVEDLAELHEESHLPLNEVLQKYKGGPSMPAIAKLKDGASGSKPQSPYLRGRRAAAVLADAVNKAVMDPDSKPEGSSTSAAAAAAAAIVAALSGASSNDGPSSSKAALSKMETDEPDDSTVSSSSSSASKSNNTVVTNNNNNNNNNVVITDALANTAVVEQNPLTEPTICATANGSTTASSSTSSPLPATVADAKTVGPQSTTSPDSSHTPLKDKEQNGSVTSSETKPIKGVVSTTGTLNDETVTGSNDVAKKIQNGTVGSSTSTSISQSPAIIEPAAISSTSKEAKLKANAGADDDSNDDDADYDAENSSGDENEIQEDDSTDGDSDAEIDENEAMNASGDEDSTDEDVDYEDEDANEQFCANMIEEPGKDSGCTAVVAVLNGRDLYVANAGDSRCVVCRNGKSIEMSLDHKPEDDEESARILKAGGRVTLDGRVNGGLNLSRAIGDHVYKMNLELKAEEQMISALPDIKKLIITPEDEFMILACDGIWNYMTSNEVVQFVRLRLKDDTKKLSQICEELFDNCLAPNTMGDGTGCDNMTAVIIRFQSKLLELPTNIKPEETQDVLLATQAAEADAADVCLQKSLKRSLDDNVEVENANKTKRMKTDEETTTSINTLSSTTASSSNNSSSSSVASATAPEVEEPKGSDIASTTSEAIATGPLPPTST